MVVEYKRNLLCLSLVICCVCFLINKCYSSRVMYFSLERPKVTYFDRKYFANVTLKSRLLNRRDPVHYVTVNYTSLLILDNNLTVNFYFFQFLSNVYKRSFVEIHYKLCDLLEKDEIFGDALRTGYYNVPRKERVMSVLKCPLPPGTYVYLNMKFRLNALVETFPFQQGRAYINVTIKNQPNVNGYIDFQLKSVPRSNK